MPVNLTYQGENKYKTAIGAFIAFICIGLSLGYGVFRIFPLFNDENTTITMNTILVAEDNQFFSAYKPDWR
jgi:hypothetical protein